MEKNIPYHISAIVTELEQGPGYEETLLKYTYLLSKDVTLMQIYIKLGYCLKTNGFKKPLTLSLIKNSLIQEYSMQQQPIESYFADSHTTLDYEAEIRHELLKFFYEQGINEIASSVDVGLEIPEDASLANLWEDFFPQKRPPVQFSTPLPTKIQKCPSTQASQHLTPSPKKNCYSEDSEMETPRSTRGLRHLTTLVKQLVCKHQPTSFKNVAVKLIDELVVTDGPERIKEEKNVRRRVYDAINVLIAAGVFEIDGRTVSWQRHYDPIEINQKKSDSEKLQKKILEKTKALQEILNNYIAIQHLMHRNSKDNKNKSAIQFPFIMVSTPDIPKNTMSIRVNSKATYLQLKFNKAVSIFGDMDILFALGLHKLKSSQICQYLPSRDLLKFCTVDDS
jgi:Transcription factor DP/E2F/DP family winged-helix DNA-binding domain